MVMSLKNWLNPSVPESAKGNNGNLQITSAEIAAPQVTAWVAVSAVTTVNGPSIDLGARSGLAERIGILAQWVPTVPGTTPVGVTIEIQWSPDGTNWYVCPTSAQGDNRSSTSTSTGTDRTLISRGQCLARYLRWSITTPAAGLPAGSVYLWRTRI